MQYETISVTPISSSLGARVEGIDLASLQDDQFEEVRRALLEHLVLFFPEQKIDDDQHKAFAGRFAPCRPHPVREFFGDKETLNLVENDSDKPPQDDNCWHTDYSFHDEIPDVAVLLAEVVPETGGGARLWSRST